MKTKSKILNSKSAKQDEIFGVKREIIKSISKSLAVRK